MDEDGFFPRAAVTIIGLGLMGGSLALALKNRCKKIIGYDSDRSALDEAEKSGVFQLLSGDRRLVLENTDVIILAAPVFAILDWLEQLPGLCLGSAVVIDLGSTKEQIVRAMNRLPARFESVGGHPMCGKEKSGILHADPCLFSGATFALVRTETTTERSILAAEELAGLLNSVPLWIDSQTHDRWTAYSSHFPYLASTLIASITPEEVSPLVSSGFRSTTRLASSSQKMMMDIILSNRQNVLEVIRRYRETFAELEKALEQDDPALLEEILQHGYDQHQKFQHPSGRQSWN